MSEPLEVLFLVLFVGAAGFCIYLSITMSRRVQAGITRWREEEKQTLETQLRQIAYGEARVELERWRQEQEQAIRLDAVQRSVAVTKGKVTEHIVPYLPGFDLDPKDVRFLGTPIDLIVYQVLPSEIITTTCLEHMNHRLRCRVTKSTRSTVLPDMPASIGERYASTKRIVPNYQRY
jgi:predicted Holliday junction resolvase-like endonuclease